MSIQRLARSLRDHKRAALEARIPGSRKVQIGPTAALTMPMTPPLPAGKLIVLGRDSNGDIFAIPDQNRSTHCH